MADYVLIDDPRLQARTRARYEREVAELSKLGFRLLAYGREALGPYSVVVQFPLVLLTLLNREVLSIVSPLRMAVANVLLAHNDPDSIALCMGMGVKIYTGFTDKTLLISSTFQTHALPKSSSPIIRFFPSQRIDQAWASHIQSVKGLLAKGKALLPGTSFQRYISYSLVEEDLSQYE